VTSAEMTPEEIDKLIAENANLRGELQIQGEADKAKKPSTFRRILSIVLAILAILAIVASIDAQWLKTTLEDEDQFVSTFDELIVEEDIATALSIRIADGIIEATDAEVFITENLPPDLAFIGAPITDAVSGLLANTAKPLLQSDAASTAWTATLRTTHVAVSAVLTGNGGVLASEGGQVAVDLDEVAGLVVDQAAELGLSLPDTETSFGQIVIIQSDELAAVQNVAQAISTIGWVLPLIALLLIAGAVWSAPDRRWMTAFLGFGTAFGLLGSLAVLRVGRNATLNAIEDEITRTAGEATWDIVLDRLVSASWGILALGLVVGFIAWAVGPSPRAQQFSSWISTTVGNWRKPAEADPSGFAKFLAGSKRTIELIVVAIGLLFVLFGPSLSAMRVLVTTLIVVGIVVLIEILAGPAETSSDLSLPESEHVDA
jgi:hypothetical protein